MSNPESHNRIPETSVTDEIYSLNGKTYTIIFFGTMISIIVAIIIHFPLEESIKTLLANQITRNRQCPISYTSLDLGYFLPKVILDRPVIAGRCLGQRGKSIELNKAFVQLTMPSFWPIGIKTKIHAETEDSVLNIFPRLTISGHSIQIEDTTISGKFINQFTKFPNLLQGSINAKANFELAGQKIDSGNVLIESKNLRVPAGLISGVAIPQLNLGRAEIAGVYTKKNIHIRALRIGTARSSLEAEFKGKLTPHKTNMRLTQMNLEGKFRIGDDVLEKIPFLRILLNGKKKKDGFYFVRLAGTLASPKPTFIDPI